MGCSGSKTLAMAEIQQLIEQVRSENALLEKERDKLKNQRTSDRSEEEKNILHEFRTMHNEFERELSQLKDQMLGLSIVPEKDPQTISTVKDGIEKIIQIQADLEEKSNKIREILTKREELKKEQIDYEKKIEEMTKNLEELDVALEAQEETLRSQDNIEDQIHQYEREKMILARQLKEAETTYKDLREELKDWEEVDETNYSDAASFEKMLGMTESEIKKELLQVDRDLEDLTLRIKDLEIKEVELQQTDNYLTGLSQKIAANANVISIKQNLIETQDKINDLKEEKKRVKAEIIRIKKKVSDGSYGSYDKYQSFGEVMDSKGREETLEFNVQSTLKRAKEYSLSLKSDQ
ncbi:hypothetical protein SteCoe_8619 [Stentor coeruleus]|uniref:Uncharacterized protein n=1 Tax=Stentor coeruleus TaxID=5963 RepID=A0A1R2CJQ6_9CILI|nr:hypothetical protein SteCoe_8619 [Stentor coeruleus]